ncbi:MAG: hypothetical protein CSB49_05865 [Proteobacteria bacterium]|nr:MAG: hypothetical protein CSB49_05865 [Pseudomonadota bacterium]
MLDASTDGPDLLPADLVPGVVDSFLGEVTVGKQYDSCQTPFVIDFAGGVHTIEFWIDTSSATQDFSFSVCGSWPDVVVRLRNASQSRQVSCISGPGSFAYVLANSTTCTQLGKTFTVGSCNGGFVKTPHPTSDYLLVFCRDPALGPARIRLISGP